MHKNNIISVSEWFLSFRKWLDFLCSRISWKISEVLGFKKISFSAKTLRRSIHSYFQNLIKIPQQNPVELLCIVTYGSIYEGLMMIWTTTNHINVRSERLHHGTSVKKRKQTINYLHQKGQCVQPDVTGFVFLLLTALQHPLSHCLVLIMCNRSMWSGEFRTHMYILNMPRYSWVTEGI